MGIEAFDSAVLKKQAAEKVNFHFFCSERIRKRLSCALLSRNLLVDQWNSGRIFISQENFVRNNEIVGGKSHEERSAVHKVNVYEKL